MPPPGSAAEATHPLIGEQIGSYIITRELAQGGMGIVFEAKHQTLGQRVAVKILADELAKDPKYEEYVARFFDEARVLTALQHPSIVRILDHGRVPSGTVYILMEFLDGESLEDRIGHYLQDGGALPLPEALRITRQIAAAVDAAHKKGILHRDLKPANAFLVADPEAAGAERVKLIDFGIARMLDSPFRRTTVGTILGTPEYMAPEQCQGRDLDDRADVYALGIIVYEMLTGQPPFNGSVANIILQHVMDPPPPLRESAPGVPEKVHELVHSMLAKDPTRRPTMAQVVSRVQQWELDESRRLMAPAPQPPPEEDGATQVMPRQDLSDLFDPNPTLAAPPATPPAPRPAITPRMLRPQAATRILSPETLRQPALDPKRFWRFLLIGALATALFGSAFWFALR